MGVVFLNGTTSAGKTRIARALPPILDPLHLRLDIDDGFAMLPLHLNNAPDGFFFDIDATWRGSVGRATLTAHADSAAAIARSGIGLILDEVVLVADIRAEWFALLAGINVFRVGVYCAIKELERREGARGDRLIGQAHDQFGLIHREMRYALGIDSTTRTPEQSAAIIAAAYRADY